jgi:Ni/Co efflux regulator RcnB
MRKHTLIALSLTALALATAPAFAGDGHKGRVATKGHAPMAQGHHDNGLHLGWQKKAWKRGDRIVWADVERRYYVTDYRAYHLNAPPQGYRWVRPMDDRYLLVNVATGLVAQALGY